MSILFFSSILWKKLFIISRLDLFWFRPRLVSLILVKLSSFVILVLPGCSSCRFSFLFRLSSLLFAFLFRLSSLAALNFVASSEVKDTVEDLTPRNICHPGASFAAIVAGESRLGVLAGILFLPGIGVGVEDGRGRFLASAKH